MSVRRGKVSIYWKDVTASAKMEKIGTVRRFVAEVILPALMDDTRTGWRLLVKGKLNIERPDGTQYEADSFWPKKTTECISVFVDADGNKLLL